MHPPIVEVIIVTTKLHGKIENYVNHHYKGKIKPEIVNVSDELESAGALLKVADLITSDFILMSSDIITDVNVYDLLDFHYRNESSLTVLLKKEDLESGKLKGKAPVSCNLNDYYDICLVNPQSN